MVPLNERLEEWVRDAAAVGGLESALIATADGLIVAASAAEGEPIYRAAAFVTLFQEALERVEDDLGFSSLDELALRDGSRRRFVVRPLSSEMFLVAQVPADTTWRKTTNKLVRQINRALDEVGDG